MKIPVPKIGVSQEVDLSQEEIETALRALGAFQVALYDKRKSCGSEELVSVQRDIDLSTRCIKKLHKMIEGDKKTP